MVLFVDLYGVSRADLVATVAAYAYLLVDDDAFSLKVQCMYRAYLNALAALDARLCKKDRGLAFALHFPSDKAAEKKGCNEGVEEACLFLLCYPYKTLYHYVIRIEQRVGGGRRALFPF